jgi:hypothetical protein
MTRKIRSVTIPPGGAPPAWAAYLVVLCSVTEWVPGGKELPSQAFRCRTDAERWARFVAEAMPDTTSARGPTHWVLVYALAANRRARPTFGGGICYLAYDGGGACAKAHRIPTGFGVRGQV